MSDETSKKRVVGKIFGIMLVIFLLFSGMLNILLMVMLAVAVPHDGNEATEYKSQTIEGKGESKILLIELQGIIASGKMLGKNIGETPQQIKIKLKQAEKDEKVKAILIKINSPGGTVTASDTINHYINDFRKTTQKPVVAYFDAIAASGGYYVGVACDEIIAHPAGMTGSIGVIMQYFQMKELFENKLGIHPVTIKSGNFKDMASAFRDLKPAERKVLNDMVQEMYNRFLEVIIEGRPKLGKAQIKDWYLFSVEKLKENENVSAQLRDEFANAGYALTNQATIDMASEKQWQIKDGDKIYYVRKEKQKHSVYITATLYDMADGRIYTAKQALQYGLIDKIDYFPEAVKRTASLAGIAEGKYQLIKYDKPRGFLEKILDPSSQVVFPYEKSVSQFLQNSQSPGMYYIWKP